MDGLGMEFDAVRYIIEQEIGARLDGILARLDVLETAHTIEHPQTIVMDDDASIPVEALEALPVETPAIVVIDDSGNDEQVEALAEQVEELTDAVEALAGDAVEEAIEETVEDAVSDALEETEDETVSEPDATLEVETEDAVVELPIVEQEIKPERRGFLDRKLFGR